MGFEAHTHVVIETVLELAGKNTGLLSSAEHLFSVIQQGGTAVGKSPLMGPWGAVLNDAQIRDVIAYIRTLAKPPYPSEGS